MFNVNRPVLLLLSMERYELLARTLANNILKAGCPVDLIALDQGSSDPRVHELLQTVCTRYFVAEKNIGIGAGLNFLLKQAMEAGYDYFQFMANDILEQEGWVAQKTAFIGYVNDIQHGMISTYPGSDALPVVSCRYKVIGNTNYSPGHVIGQFMLHRELVEKVGYFKDFGHPYAPIDNDYNVRCERMGFTNYYIDPSQYRATHIDLQDKIYGYNKKDMIDCTWPVHVMDSTRYDEQNAYLPYPDHEHVINLRDSI